MAVPGWVGLVYSARVLKLEVRPNSLIYPFSPHFRYIFLVSLIPLYKYRTSNLASEGVFTRVVIEVQF